MVGESNLGVSNFDFVIHKIVPEVHAWPSGTWSRHLPLLMDLLCNGLGQKYGCRLHRVRAGVCLRCKRLYEARYCEFSWDYKLYSLRQRIEGDSRSTISTYRLIEMILAGTVEGDSVEATVEQ